MRTYLLKRFLMTVLVLLLVTVYLTLLIHVVPGDPAKTLLGPRAKPELIAKVRAAMDLDKPVLMQIRNAVWHILHGDLGTDIFTGRPISSLIGSALPHTLILAWTSLGLALPAVALAITWIDYLARLVRASLLEVLNQTYIRAAMAAGLSQRQIFYKYALKNALIPTVAVLGVGVGNLMAGAVFVELIFTRPGMGTLIYNAIQGRNYPIVRAGVLVVAVLFVLANLLADLVYTYLDPRIQLDKARG